MERFRALGLTLVAVAVAGCSMTGTGGNAPNAAVPVAPPAVAYGAFLEGPVGAKLGEADRDKALAAEQDALASGQRRTWKGDHGAYGYVEPAPPSAAVEAGAEACRAFTSTVYIAGRPQVGHGTGCQNPDGSYRVAS